MKRKLEVMLVSSKLLFLKFKKISWYPSDKSKDKKVQRGFKENKYQNIYWNIFRKVWIKCKPIKEKIIDEKNVFLEKLSEKLFVLSKKTQFYLKKKEINSKYKSNHFLYKEKSDKLEAKKQYKSSMQEIKDNEKEAKKQYKEKRNSLKEELKLSLDKVKNDPSLDKSTIKSSKTKATKELKVALRQEYSSLFWNYVKKDEAKKNECIAQVKNLKLSYGNPTDGTQKLVIRGASIKLYKGEVLALIGESGSGKSVITSTLLGLQGNNAIMQEGKIIVKGVETQTFNQKQWMNSGIRGVFVSSVFQNPMTTLNPTMKVGKQIAESLIIHNHVENKSQAKAKSIELLNRVQIKNPELIYDRYPHELSGGMKQRIVIAAIIAAKPEIIVFDEPTTALDPTIQAEILEIILKIVKEENVASVFITHDLGVVAMIADKISIMYAGKVIEYGKANEILFHPQHPYTWGLLGSMPDVNTSKRLDIIKGSVPQDLSSINGDAFAPRNNYALDIDYDEEPPFFQISDTHFASTWLLHPDIPKYLPPKVIVDRWNEFRKKGKYLAKPVQIDDVNEYI